MQADQGILGRLNLTGKRLSKGHRRIAAFLTDHYDRAVFMTAARLGEVAEVSESTVVRFANALGYEGYPQMRSALREIVRHRLTSAQRFSIADDLPPDELPRAVLQNDMNNIKATIDGLDWDVFDEVVRTINQAQSIYILGLRSAAPLAAFLAYYLRFIFDNVREVGDMMSDTFETIARIRPEDVLIAVSFPRYSTRTLESMQFAKSRGVKVVGITDGALSPLHTVSDLCLDARTEMTSFADSLAAPFSLLNALIAALGADNRERLKRNFSQMESVWNTFRVYAAHE